MINLGERIKQAREEKKLTMSALARETQMSAMHISRIEKDEANPTGNILWRIAKALDKPVSYFFGDLTEEVHAFVIIDIDDECFAERLSALFRSMKQVSYSIPYKNKKKILVALSTSRFEEIGEFVLNHCLILRGIESTETIFRLKTYIEREIKEEEQAYRGFWMISVPYILQEKVAEMMGEIPEVKVCYAISGSNKDILAICHADSADKLRNVYKNLEENLEAIGKASFEFRLDNLDENCYVVSSVVLNK